MARPVVYTPEIAAKICALLVDGCSLRTLCAKPGMPALSTLLTWLGENPDFREQYALAREMLAETLADEIVEIADEAQGCDTAGVNAAKLRVDSRKWVAAKLWPKKYGDKLTPETSGKEGGALPPVAMSTDEFRQIAKDLADEI